MKSSLMNSSIEVMVIRDGRELRVG